MSSTRALGGRAGGENAFAPVPTSDVAASPGADGDVHDRPPVTLLIPPTPRRSRTWNDVGAAYAFVLHVLVSVAVYVACLSQSSKAFWLPSGTATLARLLVLLGVLFSAGVACLWLVLLVHYSARGLVILPFISASFFVLLGFALVLATPSHVGWAVVAWCCALYDAVWALRSRSRFAFASVLLDTAIRLVLRLPALVRLAAVAVAGGALCILVWGVMVVELLRAGNDSFATMLALLYFVLSLLWLRALPRVVAAYTISGTVAGLVLHHHQAAARACAASTGAGEGAHETDESDESGGGAPSGADRTGQAASGSSITIASDEEEEDVVVVGIDSHVGLSDYEHVATLWDHDGEAGEGADTEDDASLFTTPAEEVLAPAVPQPLHVPPEYSPWVFLQSAMTHSFGSLCMAAALHDLSHLLWWLPASMLHAERRFRPLRCLAPLRRTLVAFGSPVVRSFNRHALPALALRGMPLTFASRAVWAQFERAGLDAVLAEDCTARLVFLAGRVSGCALALLVALASPASAPPWLLLVFLSYLVGSSLAPVVVQLAMAPIVAMLVCFATDPESLAEANTVMYHRLVRVAEVRTMQRRGSGERMRRGSSVRMNVVVAPAAHV